LPCVKRSLKKQIRAALLILALIAPAVRAGSAELAKSSSAATGAANRVEAPATPLTALQQSTAPSPVASALGSPVSTPAAAKSPAALELPSELKFVRQTYLSFGVPAAIIVVLAMLWWFWDEIGRRPGVSALLSRISRSPLPKADPRLFSIAIPSAPSTTDRKRRQVFISHAYVDRALAMRFKEEVQKCYPSVAIFCSSDPNDLPPGSKWENEIESALRDSEVFLLVATARTFERRWIWFEAGGFWFKPDDCPFVSLCFGGQRASDLPSPMSKRQAIKADGPEELQLLFSFLTKRYGLPEANVDFASMAGTLRQMEAEISSRSTPQSSGNAGQVGDKWVDSSFPDAAGLTAKWQAEGYQLVWAGEDEEARRTELEGWEYALYPEQNGRFSILRIKDRVRPLVLLKQKQT
jgi:hypothetical protein